MNAGQSTGITEDRMAHDRMVGRTEGSVHLIAATCENIPANLLTISSLPKIMAMTGPYRHARHQAGSSQRDQHGMY